MTVDKKRILVIAVVCTVLLLMLSGISGCKKEAEEDVDHEETTSSEELQQGAQGSTDTAPQEVDNGTDGLEGTAFGTLEEVPEWSFDITANYEPWDSEMPFINPLGDKEAYTEVLFAPQSGESFRYLTDDNFQREREIFGPTYKMIAPFDENKTQDENLALLTDIKAYVKQLNGEVIGTTQYSILFTAQDEEDIHWWCYIEAAYGEFEITVIEENELKIDQSITITTADYPDGAYYFTSYHDGKIFQSTTTEIHKGMCTLNIYKDSSYGVYTRSQNYSLSMVDFQGSLFTLDDALLDEGIYYWGVHWYPETDPGKITISLEDAGELPYVKMGEALGGITVSTAVAESISVTPTGQDNLYINHPEVASGGFKMDLTPDGDYLMYVPSGLWDVSLIPRGDGLINDYKTLMVPVNTGEITKVHIPLGYEQLLSNEVQDTGMAGLVMELPKANGNQVTFDFSLVDRDAQDVLPDLSNTVIREGGKEVEILSIIRNEVPPSVVLLLDSSGSMKGQMEQTLDAARTFIEGLPEDTYLKIIDFDTKAKVLEGTTPSQGLYALSSIGVGGATALYDTIIEGYSQLQDRSRPTLVVFTDGTDANYNDTAAGSEATYEEVLSIVDANAIAMYTIGFGEGHDATTLKDLAERSAGLYYSAEDDSALTEVFEAINNKLSNSFKASYERPKATSPTDIPMISFVIDVSGSMFSDDFPNHGWRLDDVKYVFHDFVLSLPEDTQLQLMSFNSEVHIDQSSTTDKVRILRGFGDLEAAGGTDIIGSVTAGYKTLEIMPSTKKVLIYLTDAALGVDDEDQDAFDMILDQMAEEQMNVLWVGMGMDEDSPEFVYAAERSGGRYVLSEDPSVLSKVFEEVIAETIDAPSENIYANIQIDVEKVSEDGRRTPFTANIIEELPPLPISNEVTLAETINYETGLPLKQYDLESAQKITGTDEPGKDAKVLKRMPIDSGGENEAIRIEISEMTYLAALKGVSAPSGFRYLAVDMAIKHILPLQEMMVYPEGTGHPASWVGGGKAAQGELKMVKVPYMIPDFKSHFFMTYNVDSSYPASSATWLAKDSLTTPGNQSLTVQADNSEEGILIFVVPDEATEQCSLHFYDTNYGHIDVPMIGVMERNDVSIDTLPTEVTSTLSDTFDLTVKGYSDVYSIMNLDYAEDSSVYRMVEGAFDSKVQALINVNPLDRFKMRFPTENGDFYIPLNPITAMLPSGFAQPRMLAPGSFNEARLVFQIPEGLQENQSEIYVDLADGEGIAKVHEGHKLPAERLASYSHEYFDLTINSLLRTDEVGTSYGNWVVADVTIHDIKDGYGTSGLEELFYLENAVVTDEEAERDKQSESGSLGNFASFVVAPGDLLPDSTTDWLILGIDEETVVYDGASLRGFVVFGMPGEADPSNYTLKSEMIEEVDVSIQEGDIDDTLFAYENTFYLDERYAEELSEAIDEVVGRYHANHPEKDESLVGSGGFEEEQQQSVVAPAVTIYGQELIQAIDSEEELWTLLRNLNYTPSTEMTVDAYSLSREALIAQNSGSSPDMAFMAYETLCELGFKPALRVAKLTDKGKKAIQDMSGYDSVNLYQVPLISYENHQGEIQYMVMPFVKPIDELDGLVYVEDPTIREFYPLDAYVTVSVYGKFIGGSAADLAVDVVDALGGDAEGDDSYEHELFASSIRLDTLSLDAMDVIMVKELNELNVLISTAGGDSVGSSPVNLLDMSVETIEVKVLMQGEEEWVHRVAVGEHEAPEKVFMTLSLNAPSITDKAARALANKYEAVRSEIDDPDSLTAMRFYTRRMINDFIYQQRLIEDDMAEVYGMVTNHVDTEKGIAITLKLTDKLRTSIDLLETDADLHTGDDKAKESYRLIHGINMSILESEVLDNGYGLTEIWTAMPDTGVIMTIDSDDIGSDEVEALLGLGMRQSMIDYLRETNKLLLIQSEPSLIDGEEHWAWYEVDPYSYEIVSVLDTGEHGALTSETVIQTGVGVAQYAIGAFKGVETSVWAVAAYSLELSDYNEILKKAKALALGIAENLSALDPKGMLTDMAKEEAQKAAENALGARIPGKPGIPGSPELPNREDYMGYQNGFKAGVEYYFEAAK